MAEHAHNTPAPDAELLRLGRERDLICSALASIDALDNRREAVRNRMNAVPAAGYDGLAAKCVSAVYVYSSNPDDLDVCDFLLNAADVFGIRNGRPWLDGPIADIEASARGLRARLGRE